MIFYIDEDVDDIDMTMDIDIDWRIISICTYKYGYR